MSTTLKLYTTAAAITKAIGSIERRGKKLDADIQITGLSCLNHNQEHGDVTLLCKLFNAMPKGSRRNALADWALKFGKVVLNEDKSTAKELPFLFKKTGSTDLSAASETPWYDCKPEKELLEEFNFEAQWASLIKKAMAAGQAGIPIKGAELMSRLQAAMIVEHDPLAPVQDDDSMI